MFHLIDSACELSCVLFIPSVIVKVTEVSDGTPRGRVAGISCVVMFPEVEIASLILLGSITGAVRVVA